MATRIRQIRATTPNVLLLDGGDTIQGAPTGWLEARRPSGGPHFVATAMNALGYDAMTVGNHEFNFGLDVLRRAQKDSTFPWLSANTRNVTDGSAAFPEYLVKELGGVRVGVLGLTTPNIPGWEPAANRPGLTWEDPVETAKRLVPLLRGEKRCDVVVVLFHSGLEADPVDGRAERDRAREPGRRPRAGGAGNRPDPDGPHPPQALADARSRRTRDAARALGRGARSRRPRRRTRGGQGDRRRGDRRRSSPPTPPSPSTPRSPRSRKGRTSGRSPT